MTGVWGDHSPQLRQPSWYTRIDLCWPLGSSGSLRTRPLSLGHALMNDHGGYPAPTVMIDLRAYLAPDRHGERTSFSSKGRGKTWLSPVWPSAVASHQ